jgi:hypothetical protein
MGHRFVIMQGDQLVEYDCYEDIPDDFDHVIEFLPEIPPEPHTHEQHEEIDSWHDRFLRLMRIENVSSSKTG